jgi:GTP1/Obg family GTP-binding protein
MFRLPYVQTADSLIDKAFRTGSKDAGKVRGMGRQRPDKIFKGELRRVESISAIVE